MTTSASPPVPASRIGRLLGNRRLRLTLTKFAIGSVAATIASQATLTALYLFGGVNATIASLLAFVAGAIPNFLINRNWTWGHRGELDIRGEVLPYLAVIVATGLAATALTTLADWVITPMVPSRGMRTVLLNVSYLSSYAVLFVVKFVLLNRVFGGGKRTPEATSPSSPERS